MRRLLAQQFWGVMILTGILILLVTVGAWTTVVNDQREDTGRCPSISGASPNGVDRGGWAEPDWCSYVDDQSGEAYYPDGGNLAGPIHITPFSDALTIGVTVLLLTWAALLVNKLTLRRQREEA